MISESASFDEFIEKMELEGVEIKRGKHISFRCGVLGQERMTRGRQIGEGYTEDAIRARIDHDEQYLSEHHLKQDAASSAERKSVIRPETDSVQSENPKAAERRTADKKSDSEKERDGRIIQKQEHQSSCKNIGVGESEKLTRVRKCG